MPCASDGRTGVVDRSIATVNPHTADAGTLAGAGALFIDIDMIANSGTQSGLAGDHAPPTRPRPG